MVNFILLAHLGATFYMCGVIWFVQIVHYPLFGAVDADSFPKYEQAHKRLTTRVVAPAMLTEVATAALLSLQLPTNIDPKLLWLANGLLALIWISTVLLQIPQHTSLSVKFSKEAHKKLVLTNWLRTGMWSLRAVLVGYLALSVMTE